MAQHKDRHHRPSGVPVDFATVPEEIRVLKQWIMWRFDWNVQQGAWAKVPYQTNGQKASSTDATTWSTFDSVMVTFEQSKSSFDGIGFVFTPTSGYVGIDVDECMEDVYGESRLNAFATRVVERLNTYTEMSPSLTGVHCIGTAKEFKGMNVTYRGHKIEAYSAGRYFTFTGLSWDESPRPIRDINEDVQAIINAVRKTSEKPGNDNVVQPTLSLSLQSRLEMALKDPKCSSLFYGNIIEYGNDDSAADMALANKLAFYASKDRSMLDAMFRQSKLMRPKWDEVHGHDTYGNITMDKAIASCSASLGTKKAAPAIKTESDYGTRRLRRFTMTDLKDKAFEYYKSGGSRGVDPGWVELEPYYRPAKSMLSIVTGEPGSGKSNFIDCLCSRIALKHDWKFTFASFETLPIERHVLTLCQIYLKVPTLKWMPNAATEDQLEQAIDALSSHFHFIMPDDHELNINSILEYVDDDIKDYGIDGFVLDPFTELEQNRLNGQSQTEMIERILRDLQRFTRQRQIHTWLIAHPTKSGDTYKDGRPTMRSISGSANFYNKADFGLIIHRHDDDKTTVFVDKVRFDSNGGRGSVEFIYSASQRDYYTFKPYRGYEEDD